MENANIAIGLSRDVRILQIKNSAIESPARMPARINGAKTSLPLTWTIRTTSGRRRDAGWPRILATGVRTVTGILDM